MTVKALIAVVIGVVAFVVVDSLNTMGALLSNGQMKTPLSQGNLSELSYGNPELANCNITVGQVQRLYTEYPNKDKEKVRSSRKLLNITALLTLLQERIRVALTQWRPYAVMYR